MTTEQAIYAMLTQGTGKHMLDSGGDSGRHWQHNQKKTIEDFRNEPEVEPSFWDGKFEYCVVNLFHYLQKVLEMDEFALEVNNYLNDLREEHKDDWDKSFHWVQECMEEVESYGVENIKGPWNSYNYEENISQTILWMTFTHGEDAYCLLQIHQGADVRGGYTDTVCFKLTGYLTGQVDIFGYVNDEPVSNCYNGYSITYDEGENQDEEVEFTEDDEYGFHTGEMDFTYIYFE